jgi:hypothetical protein
MKDKRIKIYKVNGINAEYMYDVEVMTSLDSLCMDVRENFAREYYWKLFGEYDNEKYWNKHLKEIKKMNDEEMFIKCLKYSGICNAVILPTDFFLMFPNAVLDNFDLDVEVTDWFLETVKKKIDLEYIKTYVSEHTPDEITKEFYHGWCGEISDFWSL